MKPKSKSAKQSWQNNEDVQEEVEEEEGKEEQVEEDAPWQEILLTCRLSGGQLELG